MISNTSPLIFFSKINKLNILKELFTTITIPNAVKEEILAKDKPGTLAIEKAIEEKWIKIVNPESPLEVSLGKGEKFAISLALEKKDSLIIDDLGAIKLARSLHIETLRTTSIILIAVKRKIIKKEEAISLINKIISEGYYIS